MRYPFLRVAAAALFLPLAGCSTWDDWMSYIGSDSASKCPDAAILAAVSSLPAFDPSKGFDPSNIQYDVALTDITMRCSYSKADHTADSQLHLYYRATRPPGGREARYHVPYFVAVASGGDILQKKIYWVDIAFDDGATSTLGDIQLDYPTIVIARNKQAYDYHLVAGFQLTKDQLQYLAKIGPYVP
jgi:hypothetical protein